MILCPNRTEPLVEYSYPIALAASTDPDILYVHEILSQPDNADFIQAMQLEINSMNKHGHWKLVRRSTIPDTTKILPTVWAMRRKRRIATGRSINGKQG
jgi:hypothetical protein